jgi:hypothetical protein
MGTEEISAQLQEYLINRIDTQKNSIDTQLKVNK